MPSPSPPSYHNTLVQVALAVPVADFFDYLCPSHLPLPSPCIRVQVPFGKRLLIGIVIAHTTKSSIAPEKLRAIDTILDDKPIFDNSLLDTARWLSGYYHYPLGETLAVMLPTLIKQGKALPTVSKTHHITLPITLKYRPPTPNDEQLFAIRQICQALDNKIYQGFLLNGVTGSGKTEVYLQVMHHALNLGKQVLILVPEIGLTTQTKQRFSERFAVDVLVLHSHISDKLRLAGWQAIQCGTAKIIIATRSSLFYPFANLGLIVVDECHDISYKQQDHLRYHTCDCALYLGFCHHIPVVLGSATPSLEQLYLVKTGKLTNLPLTTRANHAILPRFWLIDKRQGIHTHNNLLGEQITSKLTTATIQTIRHRLDKGEQVLIFLNRRGFAPILLCQACGWQADCPRCSSHLTLHKSHFKHHTPYLKCHHCTWQTTAPSTCPQCNSINLSTLGQGTSQLYEHLHALFANPQVSKKTYPILQIDRDTTRKKNDWDELYQTVLSGEPMILLGTQMLAKGHHFPNVTLVVIVDTDSGFLSANFRAPEHTAQQIMQVAGRAGRGDKTGDVFIQTLQPENALLTTLIHDGYLALADKLLHERHTLGLPPFSHAALITAIAYDYQKAKNAIIAAKNTLPINHPFTVLAPIDAPLVKKNNQYHIQMLILAKARNVLHQTLNQHWQSIIQLPSSQGVRLILDIDPMGW